MNGREHDRRSATAQIAAAALLPFAALSAPFAAGAAVRQVRTPEGAFVLERVLVRELADGAQIVVTRRWRIGFVQAGAGMAVSGEQIFADVAAPVHLAALARIEQARSTAEMFPIRLDGQGRLASSGEPQDSRAQLLHAIETGRLMFESGAAGSQRAQDAAGFMAQLAGMGAEAVSTMPRDLFFPAPVRSETTHTIALPNGANGEITVVTEAQVSAPSGLLHASERSIVTRIGASSRLTRERWLLTQR